ncbi:Uncharacterised protein [Mycobacteroides abscessus subsp. abscessus]|nr:Uncharacterised protein [Mycobacteroides abscessus subsp. abscessus]
MIQHHGHSGSNQNSARSFLSADIAHLSDVSWPTSNATPHRAALFPTRFGAPSLSRLFRPAPATLGTWHFPTSPVTRPRPAPLRSTSSTTRSPSTSPTTMAAQAKRPSTRRAPSPSPRSRGRRPSSISPLARCAVWSSTGPNWMSAVTTKSRASRCPAWLPPTPWWSRPIASTRTPVRDCTASWTPSMTRCTCTHSSRPPMPSGCSRASTSPTSRPPSTSR